MRTYRSLILFVALVCTGIACKKDGSSLEDKKEVPNVAIDERAQIMAEFESGTGLKQTNEVPINAGSPLEFNTVQEAINYVNNNRYGGQSQLDNPNTLSLPAPEDEGDQICYTCRTVRVIGNLPLHFSILIGYLRFKRLGPEVQYSFISDTWTLMGVHMGLNSTRQIWMNTYGGTKFRFVKLCEYYLGIKIKGLEGAFTVPFSVSGSGDVNDGTITGLIGPP